MWNQAGTDWNTTGTDLISSSEKNKDYNSTYQQNLVRINGIVYVKYLEQCLHMINAQ